MRQRGSYPVEIQAEHASGTSATSRSAALHAGGWRAEEGPPTFESGGNKIPWIYYTS